MSMLQQANARLIISTIEAHKLSEQVEIAKAQLEGAKALRKSQPGQIEFPFQHEP